MREPPLDRPDDSAPRIVYLTAGAAGMYCGSCLHDNLLARELIRQGWNLQLVPTYTPIRTDGPDVSIDQIYFGGINVFLQQKIPLFRILPAVLDRFLDSPRLIRRLTRRAHQIDPSQLGRLTVSMLRGMEGNQRKEVRRLARWLKETARPDLIVFSNILIGGCIPEIKRQWNVPILVTLQGDDLFLDQLQEPYRESSLAAIRQILPHVDRFLVHSQFYRQFMADYLKLDPGRIDVVPLGVAVEKIDPAEGKEKAIGKAIGSQDTRSAHPSPDRRDAQADPGVEPQPPIRIGYLARLAPEKGLHLLVDAFLELRHMSLGQPVRLEIAGWLGEQHQAYADAQFERLVAAGCQADFTWHGTLEGPAKRQFLASLDILSVPTTYPEPKGLYVLEAMAAGIPVVQPDHGAFGERVGESGGGLLFPPNDPHELAMALKALIQDADQRNRLGAVGRSYILKKHTASCAARQIGRRFEALLQPSKGASE